MYVVNCVFSILSRYTLIKVSSVYRIAGLQTITISAMMSTMQCYYEKEIWEIILLSYAALSACTYSLCTT